MSAETEFGTTTKRKTKADLMEQYLGKPLAILCVRYWYRGRVAEVGEDFVTLTDALAVERTGPASGEAAPTEDPIPSDLRRSLLPAAIAY